MVYDVVVSGLGPAGATFLKRLSGSGLKVLAIDREDFPRKKPCAGGLTGKAYRLLKRNFPGIEKVVRVSARVLELHHKDKRADVRSPAVLTYLTDREELDDFLFNSLPFKEFEVHTGESSLSAEREEEGTIRLRTSKGSYRCRVLVVADGANSRIASQFKVKKDVGFTYEADVSCPSEERVVIDFSDFSWGYYWAFPKGDFITTGLGEFKNRGLFKELPSLLSHFNKKHGIGGKVIWERGFPIPAGRRRNDVYRKQILFLGDSGGLVDPLTGEGIFYAARSGEIGAEVVKTAFERGNLRALELYRELIDRDMGSEFFWARMVGRLFFPLRNLNFLILKRSEEVALLAARLLSGDVSYREGFFNYLKLFPGALFK
jgi:geranylgeranyl reductase family protein